MKRVMLLLLCLWPLVPLGAGAGATAILKGTVTDGRTGKPLANVQVTAVSASGNVSSRTDVKGFYTLFDVPPGPTIVAFQSEGFMLQENLLCVYPGLTRTISTQLHEHSGEGYVLMTSMMRSPVLDETDSTHYIGPC